MSEPWYRQQPTGVSYLVERLAVMLKLRDTDNLPGPRYKSEGYRIEELVRGLHVRSNTHVLSYFYL